MDDNLLYLFRTFGLAILLGALMGLERERSGHRAAGLRTFTLVSLFGSLMATLAQKGDNVWLLGAGLIGVAALALSGNIIEARKHPDVGLTTEIALLIAFGVGAMVCYHRAPVAVAIALATTAILYFKPHLHAFSRRLEQRDLYAIFQFGLVTFIILPILPDQPFGPFGTLNPHHIWLMVVFISGLSLTGYIVMKLASRRWRGPVLGLLGGLVSSTATTLTFSRHARKDPGLTRLAAVVVVLASTVVMVRVAVEAAVIHLELMRLLALPVTLMFGAGLVAAAMIWRQSRQEESPIPETRNPAELTGAVTFGLLYGLVLMAVSAGKEYFGNEGVYVVSFISGLTDVDAITLTSARLASKGRLPLEQACNAVIIAVLANIAFKLAMVRILGGFRLAVLTSLGFGAIGAAGALSLLL